MTLQLLVLSELSLKSSPNEGVVTRIGADVVDAPLLSVALEL